MGSSAWTDRAKYCPNGGIPFASSLTAASSGSKNAMMAPFARSPKGLLCRAKAARVRGPRLWGSDGLVCLADAATSTATTGAGPSTAVGWLRGPRRRSWSLPAVPGKACLRRLCDLQRGSQSEGACPPARSTRFVWSRAVAHLPGGRGVQLEPFSYRENAPEGSGQSATHVKVSLFPPKTVQKS